MFLTVQTLAERCDLEVVSGDATKTIDSAASLEVAGPAQLAFSAKEISPEKLAGINAGALIIPKAMARAPVSDRTCILPSGDPELDFARCLDFLYPPPDFGVGLSEGARIDPDAEIGEECFIDDFVTVAAGARIGRGSRLLAGCRIGRDVQIGDGCTLHPNVVLYHGTVLGDNVTIHAGTVIGADGYGYKQRNGMHVKFPQVGTVRIENHVEIGANACIDRAALGETVVGEGSKLDNLVHIAHGVRLGKHVLMCGQSGIGGSTLIDDYAVLVSQSGVADHVRVGKGAMVLAQAGVIGNIEDGAVVVGFPAADRKESLREMATIKRLVAMYKPLKTLVDMLPGLSAPGKSNP
jgi:UDP-3-O-[3-hydroxymyristoyl] glucosamine N-acyltransferase